jgi:hypothetical protein
MASEEIAGGSEHGWKVRDGEVTRGTSRASTRFQVIPFAELNFLIVVTELNMVRYTAISTITTDHQTVSPPGHTPRRVAPLTENNNAGTRCSWA